MKDTAVMNRAEQPASDAELMRRAQEEDDESALALLFSRHADRFWRVAYLMLHGKQDADDAMQETFASALEHRHTYRNIAEPAAWFYRIVVNHCRQKIRRRKIMEERADTRALNRGRPPHRHPHGVLTSIVRRETNRRLAVALGFLSETQRDAFILHHVEGLSFRNVAHILDSTEGAVRVQAHRARQALQEHLGEGEISAE